MAPTVPAAIKIHPDLPPNMLRALRARLAEILCGQGVTLPDGIGLTEDALPVFADGALETGWLGPPDHHRVC